MLQYDKSFTIVFKYKIPHFKNKIIQINELFRVNVSNDIIFEEFNIKDLTLFLENIISCFSGSLIAKGYIKTNDDRPKEQYLQNIEYEKKIPIINESEYIEMEAISFTGISQIFLIYHITNEAFYAIKKRNMSYFESQKLYERELNNYQQIDYPSLCKIFGITKENHLIIEYINGKTLSDFKITTNQTRFSIIFQLVFALNYLQKHNFVYRDLKPDNIMIDNNKNVVLIDFDRMVINNGENEECTNDFGHAFIAKELISEKSDISDKNDIFSLGMIIYYILNNKQFPKVNEPVNENAFRDYPIIKKLYQKCINENKAERPTLYEIIFDVIKEPKVPNLNVLKEIFSNTNANFDFIYNLNKMDRQYQLHLFMKTCRISNINENDAIKYYSNLNNQIESITLNDLGNMYLQNKYVKMDINKAIHYLELAANQNYANSQFSLGIFYFQGKYIQRDIEKAKYFLSQAAKQNHLGALFFLGIANIRDDIDEKNIKENIHYFVNAANQGHSDSQFFLGLLYHKYINESNSIEKAIQYYSLASKQNHIEALFNLGDVYIQGKYIEININKAIYYFTKAADQNHPKAQYYLGFLYSEGKYIQKNINKAIYYYNLAANQNYPEAQYNLGILYSEGKYITRDINKAIYYYNLAANQNYPEAQYNLGILYSEGKYITRDINKAIYYYNLAANQNYPEAQYNLGFLYSEGKYIARDIIKAIYYYNLAANQHHSKAQFILGEIYLSDLYVKQDIELSIHYYSSASSNSPEALYNLGCIYLEGKHGKKDIQKAIYYFSLSANQNFVQAQYNLGFIYETYSPINIDKAIKYYKLAVNQNYPAAQCNLGKIYATKCCPIDMKKAIYYYNLSASNNFAPALYNLGNIYLEGTYVTQDIKKAIDYYISASNQNYSNAQFKLGYIYHCGLYVAQNISKAIQYYSEAASNNNAFALYILGTIYYEGNYVKKDIQKAIQYLSRAANQDCLPAQSYLGYVYITSLDIKKGYNYIMLASEKKDVQACFMNGFLYQEGKYIKKNIQKAIEYYKNASSFNNQYAKNNLGIIYKHGCESIEKRMDYAIEYFKESIKQKNDYLSMYNLAHIYLYEKGMEDKINEAIQLLFKSFVLSIRSFAKFIDSFLLLYVVFIKKNGFDKKAFKEEIEYMSSKANEIYDVTSDKFYDIIFALYDELCKHFRISHQFIDDLYENYRNIDFIYDISIKPVQFSTMDTGETIEKYEKKNISNEFFEGFGA